MMPVRIAVNSEDINEEFVLQRFGAFSVERFEGGVSFCLKPSQVLFEVSNCVSNQFKVSFSNELALLFSNNINDFKTVSIYSELGEFINYLLVSIAPCLDRLNSKKPHADFFMEIGGNDSSVPDIQETSEAAEEIKVFLEWQMQQVIAMSNLLILENFGKIVEREILALLSGDALTKLRDSAEEKKVRSELGYSQAALMNPNVTDLGEQVYPEAYDNILLLKKRTEKKDGSVQWKTIFYLDNDKNPIFALYLIYTTEKANQARFKLHFYNAIVSSQVWTIVNDLKRQSSQKDDNDWQLDGFTYDTLHKIILEVESHAQKKQKKGWMASLKTQFKKLITTQEDIELSDKQALNDFFTLMLKKDERGESIVSGEVSYYKNKVDAKRDKREKAKVHLLEIESLKVSGDADKKSEGGVDVYAEWMSFCSQEITQETKVKWIKNQNLFESSCSFLDDVIWVRFKKLAIVVEIGVNAVLSGDSHYYLGLKFGDNATVEKLIKFFDGLTKNSRNEGILKKESFLGIKYLYAENKETGGLEVTSEFLIPIPSLVLLKALMNYCIDYNQKIEASQQATARSIFEPVPFSPEESLKLPIDFSEIVSSFENMLELATQLAVPQEAKEAHAIVGNDTFRL